MGKSPLDPTRKFLTGLSLLPLYKREDVFHTLALFQEDPSDVSLHIHILRESQSVTSITVDEDLRILLRVRKDGSILLMDVGDHIRVYGA